MALAIGIAGLVGGCDGDGGDSDGGLDAGAAANDAGPLDGGPGDAGPDAGCVLAGGDCVNPLACCSLSCSATIVDGMTVSLCN